MSLCPAAARLLTDVRHLHRSCSSWPACGGANGSIRFEPELAHGANAGLKKGVNFLKEFKERYRDRLAWYDAARNSKGAFKTKSVAGWQKGEDAITDALLLSRCELLLKPSSALSEFAVYLAGGRLSLEKGTVVEMQFRGQE